MTQTSVAHLLGVSGRIAEQGFRIQWFMEVPSSRKCPARTGRDSLREALGKQAFRNWPQHHAGNKQTSRDPNNQMQVIFTGPM